VLFNALLLLIALLAPLSVASFPQRGEWAVFFPKDELLDSPEEPFALTLTELTPGSHIIAVRATDSAGHTNSAEITVVVPAK
jgi:hypothetical protein